MVATFSLSLAGQRCTESRDSVTSLWRPPKFDNARFVALISNYGKEPLQATILATIRPLEFPSFIFRLASPHLLFSLDSFHKQFYVTCSIIRRYVDAKCLRIRHIPFSREEEKNCQRLTKETFSKSHFRASMKNFRAEFEWDECRDWTALRADKKRCDVKQSRIPFCVWKRNHQSS